MAATNPQKWFEILEVILQRRPDQAEAEWSWVMEQLGLGTQYFIAIYEAIKEERWRTAENPGAYLKTVVKRHKSVERRQKARLGLLANPREQLISVNGSELDGEPLTAEEVLEGMAHEQEGGETLKGSDGTWRTAAGWQRHDGGGQTKPGKAKPETPAKRRTLDAFARRAFMIYAAGKEKNGQYFYVEEGPERLADWQKWAEDAGLSELEKKVAVYKLSGIGREQALREQPDDESRRALQAAWKKFERTALERLRGVVREEEEEDA
jgi:hypothetical protein